jgi:Uma2 family endonuclease
MAHQTFAPWAEPVPDAPYPMTIDQLMDLPDDGWTYELVEGRLVRMPPSGGGASGMGMLLGAPLTTFVRSRGLGWVTGADGEYVLSIPGQPVTSFAPDLAFVRAEHVPQRASPEWDRPWHVAPDLAVEIASPNQYRPKMAIKAALYLAAGVRLVWIVWPRYQQVDIWRPGSAQPIATLGAGDALDGLDVLPGFGYPLNQLFV